MNNTVYNNIIVDAFSELVPSLHIAPLNLTKMDATDTVCNLRDIFHTDKYISLHKKARSAITTALEDLHLQKEDVVTILTTSGNYYVSGCVTKAIESVCRWNREVTDETKTILVIHEFGYPYKGLSGLKKYGLPIIEDCAYAFFSKDEEIGTVGDNVIYSLPKAFNMQMGGVMISRNKIDDRVSQEERAYILSHLSAGWKDCEAIISQRIENHNYLAAALAPYGIQPFFDFVDGVVPGVFMFRWRDDMDYPALKEFMQRNGVESSVFYGQSAFFVPVHQNLSRSELDYMIKLLKYFYETRERK